MSNVWYGSLINRLAERGNSTKPVVGIGATEFGWSDRSAYEIIAVKDDRHITVRRLKAIRTDKNGMSEDQDYKFESNPNGAKHNLFLTAKGQWRERYPNGHLGCNKFVIGYAEEYYDYSF